MSVRLLGVVMACTVVLAGCGHDAGHDDVPPPVWVDDEVSFDADGLTLHGTYRHLSGGGKVPAALLISESGVTDRNGDNNVAGPIGNMRQLAEYLSDRGVATLRYDKIGTGATGLGPHADKPSDVGSAVYTDGARAAARFLAGQPGTESMSVYGLGEGAIHALTLAGDTARGVPKIHSLGLLQPIGARYLDLISTRVSADLAGAVRSGAKTRQQADQVLDTWRDAVAQIRSQGTVPANLPDGLGAIVNPHNVKAVAEADAIDPVELATRVPAGTPVLLTCSDSDAQASCTGIEPLTRALSHTALTRVDLKGVNHVLRDDPTDNVANYAKKAPLSPQLTDALNTFVTE